MERYERCKSSGVEWIGEIPEHWDLRKLKYVASVQPSNVDKKTIEGELPVFLCNYMDVYKNEFIDSSIIFMEATATEAEIAKFKIKKGDVLVTKDSETPDDIANPAFVKDDFENANVICAYHLTQIRPNRRELIGEYLFRLFQETKYKGQFEVAANGVTRFALSVSAFSDAFVPLPRPEEQTAIANYLDEKTAQMDMLIAKKQKLIELLKEERTAIIEKAVKYGLNENDQFMESKLDWFDRIPTRWAKTAIKYIAKRSKDSIVDGPFGSSVNVDTDYVTEGIPVVRTINITDKGFSEDDLRFMRIDKFDELKRHAVYPGDILFSKVGTIGNSCIFPNHIHKGILSTTGSCKITVNPELIINEYLVYLLRAMKEYFHLLASSNVQPFLNMSTIRNVRIAVPPIEEQRQAIDFIEDSSIEIDLTISKIEKEIELLHEYRAALISEVVTGKIKVA
jgi:type I restriction enzyme, S subunit